MIRSAVLLAFLVTATGCTLSSTVPLIEKPELVPGLDDGRYQNYAVTDPSKLHKVPRRLRARCIWPGYVFILTDDKGKVHEPIAPPYCPFSEPGKPPSPPPSLVRDGAGYRIDGDPAAFMRLRGTIFLMQSLGRQDTSDGDAPHFDYYLARSVPGGLDIAWLPCADFPSLTKTKTMAAAAPDTEVAHSDDVKAKRRRFRHRGPVPSVSEGNVISMSCEATALAPIRPELDAEVQKLIDRKLPVMSLLRREPDAAAGAPAKPPR